MRMWMIPPDLLCRQHLLGEHKEIHMLIGTVNKGKNLGRFLTDRLVDTVQAHARHGVLVKEMKRRGYNHRSPLLPYTEECPSCQTVDRARSARDLYDRCNECRSNLVDYANNRASWAPSRQSHLVKSILAYHREQECTSA